MLIHLSERFVLDVDFTVNDWPDDIGDMYATFDKAGMILLEGWSYDIQWPPKLLHEDGGIDSDGVTGDPDVFISALSAFRALADSGAIGRVGISISYENPFWFFHDLSHSEHDFTGDISTRVVTVGMVDSAAEDRANDEGAVGAREMMSDIDILAELSKLQGDFRERFGGGSGAFDRFSALVGESEGNGWAESWVSDVALDARGSDHPDEYVSECAWGAMLSTDQVLDVRRSLGDWWDDDTGRELEISDAHEALEATARRALEGAAMARIT